MLKPSQRQPDLMQLLYEHSQTVEVAVEVTENSSYRSILKITLSMIQILLNLDLEIETKGNCVKER